MVFEDRFVGHVSDGVLFQELRDMHGNPCFKASTVITNIFGHELGEGAPMLEAYGHTKEEAFARLQEEERTFNDSLWF